MCTGWPSSRSGARQPRVASDPERPATIATNAGSLARGGFPSRLRILYTFNNNNNKKNFLAPRDVVCAMRRARPCPRRRSMLVPPSPPPPGVTLVPFPPLYVPPESMLGT